MDLQHKAQPVGEAAPTAATPAGPSAGKAPGSGKEAAGGVVDGAVEWETLGGGDTPTTPSKANVQQKREGGKPRGSQEIHDAAAEGVADGGGPLPHLDKIQSSFGKHDVSGVRAHTGGAAKNATDKMGAEAYATGNDVAFNSASPSLHTAAHEAAHVVQQRGGVQLKGGVGSVGDSYEQHADAVADHVVQGKDASGLLDQMAPPQGGGGGGGGGGGAGAGGGGAVQRKAVQFDVKSDLRSAMSGIGTDEDAIYARIERATVPELRAVLADRALMAELRDELTQSEMTRVLDGLRAPLADKLRLAMDGWGTDESYIHRSLMQASTAELQAVAADRALVDRLQNELSSDDLRRVFDRLQLPLARKLEYAVDGWGTDDAYILTSCQTAPIAEVIALANDARVIALVDDDLSGADLDQFRGILARRLAQAGQPMLAFRMCMGADAVRRRRLAWIGDVTAQRAVCDVAVLTGTDGDLVRQAFQSYWEVELTVTAGASTWPVATLQAMHRELKVLPSQDTRARAWQQLQLTSDPALINRAAYGGGVFSVGSNASTDTPIPMGYGTRLTAPCAVGATTIQVEENRFTVGATVDLDSGANLETVTISAIAGTTYTISATTKAHAANAYVAQSGGGGLRDVNWLTATVRHEIAHAVESVVDTSGFKQGIGGWWSGADFDTWANAMGNPWGSTKISEEDKAAIKSKIEEHVHGAKGTLTKLPADHAIMRHWASNVPVIVAAEACLDRGDNFHNTPTALYQASNKVFTCSAWYKVFQYCNGSVLTDRLSNYTLYAAAEFFAETYTVFYEEAAAGVPDAQLGRHIKNASWASWIRTNIHERGHAPAPPASSGGPAATPGSGSPGGEAAPAGTARAGGATHGRGANNPN